MRAATAFHPVSDIFPLLENEPFEALVADITEHGLREPIILHPDGSILDGRNRYRACLEAGVEPRFETWDGKGSAVAYSVSLNLHRRHMQESQRGMVAGRIANLEHGSNQFVRQDSSKELSTSQDDAAKLLNVSVSTVKRARTVLKSGDAGLIGSVNRGETRLAAAASGIRREKPAEATKGPAAAKASRDPDRWSQLAALAAAGNTSHQIAMILGFSRGAVRTAAKRLGVTIHADSVVGKTRLHDPNRVLRALVDSLDSLVPSCEQIEPEKVDATVLADCIVVMDEAITALTRLRKRLRGVKT